MLQNSNVSNKYCSFEQSLNQKECLLVSTKILSSTNV